MKVSLQNASGIFLSGFTAGFFAAGPFLIFIYLFLNRNPALISMFPSAEKSYLGTSEYPFFTSGIIRRMNKNKKILLIGSSEFIRISNGKSVMEHLSERFQGKSNPFVASSSEGSAVSRSVYFYTGASLRKHFPDRAVIILNPFYATRANHFYKNYLDANFPDRFSVPAKIPGNPEISFPYNSDNARGMFLSSLVMLNKRIAAPFREGLFIKPKNNNNFQSIHSDEPPHRISNENKNHRSDWIFSENFSETYAGRMLSALGKLQKNEPNIKLCLLILPVNPAFYSELGLDSSKINGDLFYYAKQISGMGQIFTADELNQSHLFSDPMHFTDAGRELLAELIEKKARFCFPESFMNNSH